MEETMALRVGRRDFIAALGGAAAWPFSALEQQPDRGDRRGGRTTAVAVPTTQPAVPVIGFLNSASPGPFEPFVAAFRRGLKEVGFVEGKNVMIEYRWAEGRFDRLPELAADLVHQNVAVIAATGGPPSAQAAKAATATTPIVFVIASNPVKLGLVESFNRPGGNVTGISMLASQLETKKLQLLHGVVPKATTIGLLGNPSNANFQVITGELSEATQTLGLQLEIVKATAPPEFGAAFAALVQQGVGALVVGADPFFNSQRKALAELAARHAIPAIYEWREFAVAGGLMSYGTSLSEAYQQAGIYIGRIVRGEKPTDLPVVQPAKFEFVLNLKTAKVLGIDIPPMLLAIADEVIE
jgi:putative tryptophan/tyrosine transport system substrate-binding protein